MFWFFGHEACGLLAPWPGIEPALPTLESEVLSLDLQGSPGWMNCRMFEAVYVMILMYNGTGLRISKVKVKVAQSCSTLCGPMDYTVHRSLQAKILKWIIFPFCRESSQPRDWTQVSHIAGRSFTSWATQEAQEYHLPFSSGSSRSKNWTGVSCIAGGFFTNWTELSGKPQELPIFLQKDWIKVLGNLHISHQCF